MTPTYLLLSAQKGEEKKHFDLFYYFNNVDSQKEYQVILVAESMTLLEMIDCILVENRPP